MRLNSKKAEFPLIKILVIMLTTITILITYIIILTSYSISVDDKKLQTQIIINKLINQNCFSNEFLKIEEIKFNQDNFDLCLKNINSEKSLVRIKIEGKDALYSQEKEDDFKMKANLCNLKSNFLCSEIYYPIIFKNQNKEITTQNMVIQIIQTN